jgi:hypothetical protein
VIKLEAFPFTRYGTISWRIKTVSDDAIAGGVGSATSGLSRNGEQQDES